MKNLIIPKLQEQVIIINGKVIFIPAMLKKQAGYMVADYYLFLLLSAYPLGMTVAVVLL